jgi:hypothetical protein
MAKGKNAMDKDVPSDPSDGDICYGTVSQIDENDGNNEPGVKQSFAMLQGKCKRCRELLKFCMH